MPNMDITSTKRAFTEGIANSRPQSSCPQSLCRTERLDGECADASSWRTGQLVEVGERASGRAKAMHDMPLARRRPQLATHNVGS